MLDKNMFVIELDESTQATIKEMVTSALDELGVYEYEMVETAMSGRLCDLEDLINLDDVINNVIIDDVYKKFLDYVNEITHDMDDEIYMEDNCMHLDVEYDSDEIISIMERYNLNTLKKLKSYIYYNTNGLIKLGRDVYIEIGL